MYFTVAMAFFDLLFVMELGDKTQFAVLNLAARTGQVLAVFLGAALALTVVTLLGVATAVLAGEFILIGWLTHIAGLAFVAIGGFMLWSGRRGSSEPGEEKETSWVPPQTRKPLGILAGSLGLLLVAETGDKSQPSVVSITVKTGSPLSVSLYASLALVVVTLLGLLVGKVVTRIIQARWVFRGAAVLFIVIGLLMLAEVL